MERQPNPAALEPGCCAQVYGAVTMNNTMCLGLFLLVMHIRMLPWTYSSEVITTVGAFCPIAHVFHVSKTHSNLHCIISRDPSSRDFICDER